MQQSGTARAQIPQSEPELDPAWLVVRAAARHAELMAESRHLAASELGEDEQLRQAAPDDPVALIESRPGVGWEAVLPTADPRYALIDLYLPICTATAARPITVGHLGQSLDGFIATHAGESRWVTGPENLVHMHRMRALSDAVLVGPGTVAADDPQLTTRLVDGPNALRVILDPTRGLEPRYRLFNDGAAETLYICGKSLVKPGEHHVGCAQIAGVDETAVGEIDLHAAMALLRGRGCARLFIEGGGVTVSMFLGAGLLDRLHVAVAPLLIGDGRPAIRLPAPDALGDCHRPKYRVFRMGGDVLFDCDLRGEDDRGSPSEHPGVTRVI